MLPSRSQGRPDEQTAEDDGSKQEGAMSTIEGIRSYFVEAYIQRAERTNFSLEGPPPPFEAFLRPDICLRLLGAGWGSELPYIKPIRIPREDYLKVFYANGYHISTSKKPEWEDAATVKHTKPPIKHWAFVNFSCMDAKEAFGALSMITDECLAMGMDLNPAPTIFLSLNCTATAPSDIEDTLQNVHHLIAKHRIMGKQIGLLIVFLPDFRDCDARVDDLCKDLGVVYQYCLPEHAKKPCKQYMKGYAYQIYTKAEECKYLEHHSKREYGDYVVSSDEGIGEDGDSEESLDEGAGEDVDSEESSDEGIGEDGDTEENSHKEMGDYVDIQKQCGSQGSSQLRGPHERTREDNRPEAANSAEEMRGYIMSAGSTGPQSSFPCPDECEVLATKLTFKRPCSVLYDETLTYKRRRCMPSFVPSDLFGTIGYYGSSKSKCVEDKSLVSADRVDENLSEYNTAENFNMRNYVDLQVDQGIVLNWACVNFSCLISTEVQRFCRALSNMGDDIGMHFSWPPIQTSLVKDAVPNDIDDTLRTIRSSILEKLEMYGEELGPFVVILPEDRDFDGKIKKACKNLGVVYQCCLPHKAMKPSKQYLKKTASHIKTKVVKWDYTIPFVSEAPTIIFGAAILSGVHSDVASVVASLDWPSVSNYNALVSYQLPDEVGIQDPCKGHGGMVREHMLAFHKKLNRRAERIIFFRYVTEDQPVCVYKREINAIKLMSDFDGRGNLPLTFVVVSVQPVSLDLTNIRHCWKHDFFCNHGNECPARYRVILDENNLTAQELQSIVIKLCILRDHGSYPTISMVTPAHCAWLAAAQSRKVPVMLDRYDVGIYP